MNLDRTVKWIDKTGKQSGIQTAETSFVKQSSMLAGSSSIVSNYREIRKQRKNSNHSLVRQT